MNLIALDASTEACAVGILTSEGELFEEFEIAPRRHTELLPKMLDRVLQQSKLKKTQIEACLVGVGPGAFTGIRVGLATIQGIALGLNVPCYAISSLQAVGQQALISNPQFKGKIMATIDARMQEVYCAEYTIVNDHNLALIGEEQLIANDSLSLPEDCKIMVGTGVNCVLNDLSGIETLADCYPTANSLVQIFQHQTIKPQAPEHIQASYIRNNVTYNQAPKPAIK